MVGSCRAALYRHLLNATEAADQQLFALRGTATERGWRVVATFTDRVDLTATVRSTSPGIDSLLQGAARREFDVVAVWSIDQLARTTRHLIEVVNALHDHGIDLYVHDQGIDTSTEAGKVAFTAFAALAHFERTMIRERARISLDRARRNGTRLGRPSNMNPGMQAAIIALHERGVSVRRIARQLRVGHATICKALQAATIHPAPKGSHTYRNGIRTPQRPLERAGNRVPA